MYWLKIESIRLQDTVDKGSPLDPQSPAVYFYIGETELKTRRRIHSGVNANFAEVFGVEVNEDDFNSGRLKMEIEVFNKGFTGVRNHHVGDWHGILKDVLPRCNDRISLTLDLTHTSRSGNYTKGQIIFVATVFDGEKAEELKNSSSFSTKSNSLPQESAAVEKISDDSKAEFLSQLFGEVGELQDDVHCALQTRYITHGRIYVTNRYLLFYSKLFGSETKIRVPFHQVTSVTRGFIVMPLLIIETTLKKYTFHSFWDFETAFRMIQGYFEQFKQENGIGESGSEGTRTRTSSNIIDIEDEPEIVLCPSQESMDLETAGELFKTESAKYRYKMGVIADQRLPVSLATFAKLFVEDEAPYNYKAYHESVKDTSVVMSLWQPVGAPYDKGRDLKFFKPVNLPGLASTRGVKLQNYKRFGDVGLLLCSSTHLEDVPAADCFSVDDCLEVTASGPDAVKVTITFQVTFVKSTLMKTFIESPTNSEMKKWLGAYFEHLQKKCSDLGSTKAGRSASISAPSPSLAPVPTAAAVSAVSTNQEIKASTTPAVVTPEHAGKSGLGRPLAMGILVLLGILIILVVVLLFEVYTLNSRLVSIEKLVQQALNK
eukprot:gene763-828_t